MNRILVFTATYNEADNIAALVRDVLSQLPTAEMLVVDDHSPDGTGELLEELKKSEPRLHVVHRPAKNGLGTAHKLAVKYALQVDCDALITMDADFSHDPSYLPEMVRLLENHEFVIGSRYAPGGSCEYPLSRVVLSRVANSLTRAFLGIPLHETTTSYRGFRRSLLQRMNVDAIRADGYSYFVESINQVARLTNGLCEFPIRFADRRAGSTKISKKEIWRAWTNLMRLTLQRLAGRARPPEPAPDPRGLLPCNACGSTYLEEEYPASVREHRSASYSCTSTGHASHGRIVRCLGCGLVFTNPQLPETEVLSLYSQVEDRTYLENVDARVKTFTYNFDRILKFLPKGGRLLELGSYCGIFLKIARERGFDPTGVEPSVWASQYARDTYGVATLTGGIQTLPTEPQPFDVVCAWDVLEHVSDPMSELERINQRLRKGGVLAFSTLDYGNWLPKLLGERWPWMMDMHLYYFDQKVMKQMLDRAGFRLLDAGNYCHIITLDYFLVKLDALRIPGARLLRSVVSRTPIAHLYLPFRFGDIQLYVCEKTAELAERAGPRRRAADTREGAAATAERKREFAPQPPWPAL
jgi:dolichol-phosphate mannosyltransferase